MLQALNIAKRYGRTTALAPTTIHLDPGTFTVLLGPSGAGKSTLLRSLALLSPVSEDSISVRGIGVVDSAGKLRELHRKTGFIFQQHQLILRQTALRNTLNGRIGFHSLFHGLLPASSEDMENAYACLARVGMEGFALTAAGNLSGGQQQRVGIARALMQQPEIMLADEPVASLDPQRAYEVIELLHGICRERGICSVVSLHQVELARRFADRIIALNGGCVVFDGSAAELDDEVLNRLYATSSAETSVLPPVAEPSLKPALAA